MRSVISITLITIFFLGDLTAQKEDFNWQVGYENSPLHPDWHGSKLQFHSDSPLVSPRYRGIADFSSTNTGISDVQGNLLFYTNGTRIYDRRNDVMQNGSGLSPTPSALELLQNNEGQRISQNVLILPWPRRDSQYYVMHHYWHYDEDLPGLQTKTLYYSIVNMNKNNGYGAVTTKNEIILEDNYLMHGRMTACRHANGRDWWILIRREFTNGYYRFLLDSSGLHQVGVQEIGPWVNDRGIGEAGFSPDGHTYVYQNISELGASVKLDVYRFDRCTGMLSDPVHLEYQPVVDFTGTGIAFSPDSRYLYASSTNFIFQIDLEADDIQESRIKVAELEEFYCPPTFPLIFNHMELAPDGRIYITGGGSHCHLSYIKYPDRRGTDCEVIQHGVKLKTLNYSTLPDFPHFRLGPLHGSPCDTLGIERPPVARFRDNPVDSLDPNTIRFTDLSWYHPFQWQWSFGDGQSSMEQHPDHSYADTGLYTVCLTVTNADGQDTHCDTIHIADDATDVDLPDTRNKSLTVYPVPAREEITIEGVEPGNNLLIFNAQGRRVDELISTGSVVRYRIDALPPGIYWIRTQGQGVKFIRMR